MLQVAWTAMDMDVSRGQIKVMACPLCFAYYKPAILNNIAQYDTEPSAYGIKIKTKTNISFFVFKHH